MKPTSGSKGRTDICTEPWIRQGRPSISCSRPNAMLLQPSDSFVRRCSTQPTRCCPQKQLLSFAKNAFAGIALRGRTFVTVLQAAEVRNRDDRSDTRDLANMRTNVGTLPGIPGRGEHFFYLE